MATGTTKGRCASCGKDKGAVRCEGCLQLFCYAHLTDHRQELSQQLDEIEINRDLLRQTLNEQTNDSNKHSLIQQINQWEKDAIERIQQTAKDCKELISQYTVESRNQIEFKLTSLTVELKQIRQENEFNEIDLRQLKEKLTDLLNEFNNPSNILIQHESSSFINKISIVRPYRM